jgi:nitroreductase
MLRTGKAAFYDEVRRALGVKDGEYVAGFIYLGYPADNADRPMTRRTPASELTEWRGI